MKKGELIGVTGASGFVGSHLISGLLKEGYKVRALVRSEEKGGKLKEQGCEVASGDVRDLASLERAFQGVQAVIHLVAITREKGDTNFETVNRLGTKNVCEAMKKSGVSRLVYTSIVRAGPEVKSAYLRSKWAAEQEIRKTELDWTILRCSFIFGAGGNALETLASMIRRLPIVPVLGDGKYKQQPIFVKDVVSCLIKSLEEDKTVRNVYEIGGPEPLEYNQILDAIGEALGKKRRKLHLPLAINRPLIAIGERILPKPLITIPELELLIMDPIPEKNVIKEVFGIDPLPLREVLKKTFKEKAKTLV